MARAHFVASCALFAAAMIHLSISGLNQSSLIGAVVLVGLGSAPLLIYGTSRMLLAGIVGARWAGGRWADWLPGLCEAFGAAVVYCEFLGWLSLGAAAVLVWMVGIALHARVVGGTIRSYVWNRSGRLPMVGRGLGAHGPLMAVALAYGVATVPVLVLALEEAVPWPSLVHVLVTGFIAITIVGVGGLILPRFADVTLPRFVWTAPGLAAASAPAFLAAGVSGSLILLRVGAALGALGFGSFATTVLWVCARARRRRPSLFAYAGGAASLLGGIALGVGFAFGESAGLDLVPLHGSLNLVGFVGLFMLGGAIDLYGPSLRRSPRWQKTQSFAVAISSVAAVLAITLGFFGSPVLARSAFAVMAGAFVVQAMSGAATLVHDGRFRVGRSHVGDQTSLKDTGATQGNQLAPTGNRSPSTSSHGQFDRP